MSFIGDVLSQALQLLSQFGAELREVLWLTLLVSLVATAIGGVVGVPLGTALGLGRFRGRTPLLVAVNTGMGLPPVLAGLLILLLLWSDGPLGSFGVLFPPPAMGVPPPLLALP